MPIQEIRRDEDITNEISRRAVGGGQQLAQQNRIRLARFDQTVCPYPKTRSARRAGLQEASRSNAGSRGREEVEAD